ncbi:MAG: hypothetical protein E4H32_04380 [Nitrospirales bacterium]|nr:MAG: hypothetical protein E4H32_04380 [Nitrospirales bacterium]
MTQSEKEAHAQKLERENPEKYCWAALVGWSFGDDEFEEEENGSEGCRDESRTLDTGICWCGKFKDGKLNTAL